MGRRLELVPLRSTDVLGLYLGVDGLDVARRALLDNEVDASDSRLALRKAAPNLPDSAQGRACPEPPGTPPTEQ